MIEIDEKVLYEILKQNGMDQTSINKIMGDISQPIEKQKKKTKNITKNNYAIAEALWYSVEREMHRLKSKYPNNKRLVTAACGEVASKVFEVQDPSGKTLIEKDKTNTIRTWYYNAYKLAEKDTEEGQHLARRMKLLKEHFETYEQRNKDLLDRLEGSPFD